MMLVMRRVGVLTMMRWRRVTRGMDDVWMMGTVQWIMTFMAGMAKITICCLLLLCLI